MEHLSQFVGKSMSSDDSGWWTTMRMEEECVPFAF